MEQVAGGPAAWNGSEVARATWGKGMAGTFALSQARHALSLVVALLVARGIAAPRVFVPAYYCDSALGPVRRSAAELVFYPMTPDMEPDWEGVERLARDGSPHLFVLAHFFGAESATAGAAGSFSAGHGALLLEDAAHVLEPVGTIGRHGDFVSYSPRKYLGTPDGAVIAVRDTALAAEAERVATGMASTPRSMLGPRYALFRDRHLPWRIRTGPVPMVDFDLDPDPADSSGELWMSRSTRDHIERLGRSGLDAMVARELRTAAIIERHVAAATPLLPIERQPGAVAYFLGFKATGRAAAESSLRLLQRAGANAGTWPDLPPEVRANSDRYGAAMELRNSVIRIYPRFFNRRRPLDFIGRLPPPAG